MSQITVRQQSVAELIDKELREGRGIEEIMARFKRCVIVHGLTVNEGNVTKTAEFLRTARNNLVNWMRADRIRDHFPISAEDRERLGL